MKCDQCNGIGQVLVRNGIDVKFSPGLSSTIAAQCPRCRGAGYRWERAYPGFDCNNTDSPSGDPSPF